MASLSDYLDPDADNLLDRVDFLGMVGDAGKATVAALFSAVIGLVLSFQRAFDTIIQELELSIQLMFQEYVSTFPETMQSAVDAAGAELATFGVFSGPVSTFITVSMIVAALAAFYVFWGDLL